MEATHKPLIMDKRQFTELLIYSLKNHHVNKLTLLSFNIVFPKIKVF